MPLSIAKAANDEHGEHWGEFRKLHLATGTRTERHEAAIVIDLSRVLHFMLRRIRGSLRGELLLQLSRYELELRHDLLWVDYFHRG